jgi:uncharacterized membrane-anchored protein YhcB (DUF1043 family)
MKETISMSTNPEYESIAILEGQANGSEPEPPAALAEVVPEGPAEAVEAPAFEAVTAPEPAAPGAPAAPSVRSRPKWVVPVAIAAAGLITSSALGYLFYSTNNKLDATRHTLAQTQLTLDSTKQQLATAQADAATKKVTADYLNLYANDAGKVRTDYELVVLCSDYSSCRTSAQQALNDMQAFQADRKAANVPSSLSTSDSELGDSLSAGIAALQELINGMDTDNLAKIKDGFNKLDASMLSMAKAEADLGSELQ